MNGLSRYAFYGSLRRGMSNYLQFRHGLSFLSKQVLPGFQLYAMDLYPYAVRTGRPSDRITVEIFRVTDPQVEQAIHNLEMSVGYYYDEVFVNNTPTGIYLYKTPGPETVVNGGDWVKFFGS
jgi:gamma-glutamylcyclotransferase (GGCT)/AIG2-like uncharacterized protein YtfP